MPTPPDLEGARLLDHGDLVHGDVEGVCGDLGHLRVQTLAHLKASVQHLGRRVREQQSMQARAT